MPIAEVPVTVAVLNFNARHLLQETLESAMRMAYLPKQFLVVDDGSTDDSVAFLRREFPDVPVVEMGSNTKMLNRVRNAALEAAETDFVLITDNDITFSEDCLSQLMSVVRARPDAAVLIPRVMYKHEQSRIYIDRNRFHYLCMSIDSNRDKLLEEIEDSSSVGRTFGCGIQLIDKRKARLVGFFDPDFPMGWGDDGEFHHRMNLVDMVCYSVPKAIVYHEAIKGEPRIYGQVRNRLAMILETYTARSLVVLSPALLLYELSILVFLLAKGRHGEYWRAVLSIIKERKSLVEKRRRVQQNRLARDRDFFTSGEIYVSRAFRSSGFFRLALKGLNCIFNGYWVAMRRFID